MEYLKLFNALNHFQVKYLICGGLAVNIYGIPRMTADIDILLDFEENNISAFENAIKLLSYKNTIPISLKSFVSKEERKIAIAEKNLIAYSYYSSQMGFINLDVLIDVPIEFKELWETKTTKKNINTLLHLVSVENLIKLKEYSNRLQDQNDILLLSKLLK